MTYMNKIIALAGPTAVGKTKFAIKLADEFDGEIAKITAKVVGFRSAADAAQAISEVFLASFGPDERFSATDCSGPGEQIFLEFSEAMGVKASELDALIWYEMHAIQKRKSNFHMTRFFQ